MQKNLFWNWFKSIERINFDMEYVKSAKVVLDAIYKK